MGLAYSAALPGGAPRRAFPRSARPDASPPHRREEALLLAASPRPVAPETLLAHCAGASPRVSALAAGASARLASDAPRAAPVQALTGLRAARFGAGGLACAPGDTAAVLARNARSLAAVSFTACLELCDAQLAPLGGCGALAALSLDGCVHVSDEGLGALRPLGATLRALSLRSCKQLARVAPVLVVLPRLESLSLEQCVRLEDADLAAALRGLPSLRVLCVAHCVRVSAAAFADAWLPRHGAACRARARAGAGCAHAAACGPAAAAAAAAAAAGAAAAGVIVAAASAASAAAEAVGSAQGLRDSVVGVGGEDGSDWGSESGSASASASDGGSRPASPRVPGVVTCEVVTCAARDALARFVKVDVRCTLVDDSFWALVAHLVRLRCLLLGGTSVTDGAPAGGAARAGRPREERSSAVLARLTELRQLGLERTVVGDATLQALQGLEHLETLDLGYTVVSDMGIARHVSKMTALRWLNLEETALTDYALERLTGLTQLQHLNVGDTAVSSFGLGALSALRGLQSLNLSFTDVRELKALEPLLRLRKLSLDGEQRICDEGLASLGGLRDLQELELYSARITDAGLLEFCLSPAAASVTLLDVSCCIQISDVSVVHGVVRLAKLQELNLNQTGVTDVGVIAVIAALHRLKALNLSHTDITQVSIDAAHKHETLQRVAVQGCVLKTPPHPRTSVTPETAVAPVLRLVGA